MSDETQTTAGPPAPEPEGRVNEPRRLRRPREDRMIGGVAGGLGRAFGVDPLIFRLGFGIAAFLGGFGVLAYAVLWLFTPADGEEKAPVQRSGWAIAAAVVVGIWLIGAPFGGVDIGWGAPWGVAWIAVAALVCAGLYAAVRRGRIGGVGAFVAIAAIAFITIAFATGLAVAAAVGTAVGGGMAIAIAVIVVGVLLTVAAIGGRSLRWLAVPAVAIAIGSAISAGAGLDFEGGFGERSYRPASVSALPADGYRIGAGRIAVDLRDLDWREQRRIDLDVAAGAGQVVVAVPERVCVEAAASAGVGAIELLGNEVEGIDLEESVRGTPARSTPTLGLEASVDIGHVVVVADDDADIEVGRGGRGPWGEGLRESTAGGCPA